MLPGMMTRNAPLTPVAANTNATLPEPADLVAAWRDAGYEKWFSRDDAFDAMLRDRFGAAQAAAARGELDGWQATPEGALALVLLLDQIPRNIYRSTPAAFATDPAARRIAAASLERGYDARVAPELRSFFYLPFMHSEELADQARCVALYQALGNADGLRYAEEHRDIIARFGRFPHRNHILGREMTADELAYLEAGGFTGGQ